ncbi:uncharacterized protein LOC110827779 isoform X3 [Zootermopsis nevadensis]|uniref:uncharacterized protein LOC110827779 isoform X3 n=1 Tax=Zootermopsis nevadensis TaxID=136037 RepID=UPI000B8EDE26|nr:uncharacterized protein LOC110827779 isoform X3 [Zootermopsis nevadensis]
MQLSAMQPVCATWRQHVTWKQRWGVVTKLSPAADCLHLQLYRDSKDRYKQGQTKASLSLQHFLGVESGFTLDKESNTIAIICQDVTVILAFDTRERLIQWQVKISSNLGEDQQFLIQITSAPPKAKISTGPARLHIQDQRFCITTGVPPRLIGFWEIGQLRRYGVVQGRFCFEGGSRCGRGEGLHVCVTDQGVEITQTFQLAAQGKLSTRRRPVSRKMSAMDSPRKQIHSRHSDLSCTESFQQHVLPSADMTRSLFCSSEGDPCCACSATESVLNASRHPSAEDLLCPCRVHRGSSSPFWSSAESAAGHHHADLDSNYGCGDTTSVTELPEHFQHQDSGWSLVAPDMDRRAMPSSLERCASCISKLGAPSMSRSSTVTNTNTPTGAPFSPAWTMDNATNIPAPSNPCQHHYHVHHPHHNHPRSNTSCDRMSLSSHGSGGSSGNSEYSVPRFANPVSAPPGGSESCWYDRPRTITSTHPPIPPKSPKTPPVMPSNPASGLSSHPPAISLSEGCRCQCCPPSRPPKPVQMSTANNASDSPSKKKVKKAPMPLPPLVQQHPVAICTCHYPQHQQRVDINPYENYDIPKPLLGQSYPRDSKDDPKLGDAHSRMTITTEEYYDTPKNVKEYLTASVSGPQYGNYDTPPAAMTLRKPCGCVIKYAKKSLGAEPAMPAKAEAVEDSKGGECPCQRVMCWAENWMMLPYCRRGNGMENTGVPIHKVKLSGEGKMPVMNRSGEIAIYATVDKSTKANRRQCSCPSQQPHQDDCPQKQADSTSQPDGSNYVNVEASGNAAVPTSEDPQSCGSVACSLDYENIDFAQSLEYYENSKDFLQRVGISKEATESGEPPVPEVLETEESALYTVSNGVKFCNKCGHACHLYSPRQIPQQPLIEDGAVDAAGETSALVQSAEASTCKQDDYLMMEPAKNVSSSSEAARTHGKNFPGYLPMSPITSASCSKADMLKLRMDRAGLPSEKSASIPSLSGPIGPAVDRSRKRSFSEFPRVPGSAMMMMNHSTNSPYLRRLLHESGYESQRLHVASRRRSSSADSSRYLDDLEDLEHCRVKERDISSSHSKLSDSVCGQKPPALLPDESLGQKETFDVSTRQAESTGVEAVEADSTLVAPKVEALGEDVTSTSSGSGSLRTLVRECLVDAQQPPVTGSSVSAAVHIRRSSSVPCKSGNNRDSSSSNDSGVSTGSLKHRGADFAEFELPLTTSMSTRRHHHALQARHHAGMPLTNCLHASLPRRSKSVDPLREISFQFQNVKIPAKSSSAEAEVPICPGKRDSSKGFASPGADGAIVVPYMDSRSTSSGTSDMSDYIETLSLSSHSSSDTPDSLRLGRPATTTLRPRSGKEYQLIDRSILEGDMKGPLGGDKAPHQLRALVSQYANITPVPEKSESPSPGYMSSSPGQEREGQPLIPHPYI